MSKRIMIHDGPSVHYNTAASSLQLNFHPSVGVKFGAECYCLLEVVMGKGRKN